MLHIVPLLGEPKVVPINKMHPHHARSFPPSVLGTYVQDGSVPKLGAASLLYGLHKNDITRRKRGFYMKHERVETAHNVLAAGRDTGPGGYAKPRQDYRKMAVIGRRKEHIKATDVQSAIGKFGFVAEEAVKGIDAVDQIAITAGLHKPLKNNEAEIVQLMKNARGVERLGNAQDKHAGLFRSGLVRKKIVDAANRQHTNAARQAEETDAYASGTIFRGSSKEQSGAY